MSVAISLGLILNELLTNAKKYAFPDNSKGIVHVTLRKSEGQGVLTVEDDGIGFQVGEQNLEGKFGLLFVRQIAKQLSGCAELNSQTGKTEWKIVFSI
jgi:two-component sensor histidine kinase